MVSPARRFVAAFVDLHGTVIRETALMEAWDAATRAWPMFGVGPEIFAAHLARCLNENDASSDFQRLNFADLYLACACLEGVTRAALELHRVHLARVPAWIAHVGSTPAFADDVRQELATQLLVGTSRTGPKLAGYTGHGPLGAFIRVFAARLAIRRKPKKQDRWHEPPDERLAGGGLDPELGLLKRRYAPVFSTALADALAALTLDERNLLKLHYLDGRTIDEVADLHAVSRSTAARRLASARARVVDETLARLVTLLGKSGPNANSLLALVRSNLDLSISRALR